MNRYSFLRKSLLCCAALLGGFLLTGCDVSYAAEVDVNGEKVIQLGKNDSAEAAAEKGADAKKAGKRVKTLVVYFSRAGEQYKVGKIDKGNTAILAEKIAAKTGADTFEVVPANDEYPTEDYDKLTEMAKTEQAKKVRPPYVGPAPDLTAYDVIFVGAPVWWGDWPMIMYTFFEENADALAGRTLVPFNTHEGSGFSAFDKKLAAACPGAAVVAGTADVDGAKTAGLALTGSVCQREPDRLDAWIDGWVSDIETSEGFDFGESRESESAGPAAESAPDAADGAE